MAIAQPGFDKKAERRRLAWEFNQQNGNRWQIHWNRVTGTPASILGYKTDSYSGSPNAIARQFLRDEKSMFGIESIDRDLKLDVIHDGPQGSTTVLFSQEYKGVRILNSGYLVAVDQTGRVYYVSGDYFPEISVAVTPSLSPTGIVSVIESDLAGVRIENITKPTLLILPEVETDAARYTLVYRANATTKQPDDKWRYTIDASDGAIIEKTSLIERINGNGDVYETNPNHGGIVNRTLLGLKNISPRKLDGDNVKVINDSTSEASSSSATFVYATNNTHFDEVMAYYHSDEFERWLIGKGLGTNKVGKVTIHTEDTDPDRYAATNSSARIIYFSDGEAVKFNGLRNPTREAGVVAHEYMHVVSETFNSLNQSGGDPPGQPAAMDEAYSDYFGVAYTNQFFSDATMGEYIDEPGGKVWKRELINSHTFSEFNFIDLEPNNVTEQHDRSVIFSGALWDFRRDNNVNSSIADDIVLASFVYLDNSPSFLDGRDILKTAAIAAGKSSYLDDIDDAFAQHRIPLLTAYIWGPGLVYPGQQNTWTAGVDGDLGSISYQWYIKYQGSSTWTSLGSGTSVVQTFYQSYQTHQFKLVINSNGQSAEDIQTVVVWGGGFKAGVESTLGTTAQIPKKFALHSNYPNPFNPETTIRLELPTPAKVVFTIFDLRGAKVRALKRGALAAGYHTFSWDGKDERGLQLPSGVYFYRFEAKTTASGQTTFVKNGKMTLLR